MASNEFIEIKNILYSYSKFTYFLVHNLASVIGYKIV